MNGGGKVEKKNLGGRPQIPIDFEMVDALCEMQCTGEEIASVLKVDYDTLCRRCKEKYKIGFADYFQLKRKAGNASLRRSQFNLANSGNPTMLIWLGKQYLGQRDQLDLEHSGKDGAPIGVQYDLSRLSKKELDELERITDRAASDKK
jgi:hypothetical protein